MIAQLSDGRIDWSLHQRKDQPGKKVLGPHGGYLAYCNRCGQPFISKSRAYALSDKPVCGDDCASHSRNTITSTAFSPDRKMS